MKLKRVKPLEVKKKKKLKPVSKVRLKAPYSNESIEYVLSEAYTGEYEGNFPLEPEVIDSEIIMTEDRLEWLSKVMMTIPEFAFDTETNTLDVLGPNRHFKCVGISISWGENYNFYIPVGHVRRSEEHTSELQSRP